MELSHHREGAGEPLVLVHGFGCRWQYFEPLLPLLAEHHEVIAVDLPGFGASPPLPAGVTPTAAALADEIGRFLEGLGANPSGAHLAGSSLGGHVVLELAGQRGARSVCTLSPVGFLDARERTWLERSLAFTVWAAPRLLPVARQLCASAVGRTLVMGQTTARPWRVPADVLHANLEALAAAPGLEATRRVIGEGRFGSEQGDALAEARIPVTIGWAQRDRLVLPGGAARALERIPGARVLWLRGCGHLPFWDDPAQVAEAILSAARWDGGQAAGVDGPAGGRSKSAASGRSKPTGSREPTGSRRDDD
ncbi:MAG: alpha/beta fold hydrolase [Solirubrobacteraceae bacterium]|nr:MAG: alpha/beta hydrolase [Solirubrobacterales bacterium]